ncbi:MAG: FHA domain-containing protein [Gammaproteobacteria bacterium]|nr:FHA domain-containing protein [Gammaproteobacteria bacterium]
MISTRPILTTPLAIDLNDAAVAVVNETGLLHVEPAYVVVADGPARFGADALPVLKRWPRVTSVRYWRELTAAPLPRPLRAFESNAEIVAAHLRRLWLSHGTSSQRGLVCATPPWWTSEQVGVLIDITRKYDVAILGLVDASVAAVRNEYPGRELLHIDAGLHTLTLTQIRQSGQAGVGEREFFPSLGVESLQRLATELIARRFIEYSRFDPLHSAEMEQALFDRLPEWLGRVARDVDARLELKSGEDRFRATIDAADFRERMAAACEPLLQRLRSRIVMRGPHVLQVPQRLTDFPGVLDSLMRLPECEIHVLEPGAAAFGTLARVMPERAELPVVRMELPWDRPPVEKATTPTLPAERSECAATHLLAGHRAFRLDAGPLTIGTGLGAGERGVLLEAGLRGASRHHCTLRMENGVLMLFDHSRFGTLLNGHRVDTAAVLKAGDVISLGTPPVEFRLIAEVAGHGT